MQFLKKNYEKILLAAVVLAALAVVACLPIIVSQEKQQLQETEKSLVERKPKPLQPLDLQPMQVLLDRAQTTAILDLTNKLFNPVRWQLDAHNQLFPNPAGKEIELLQVTKLSPLYFVVSLVSVNPSAGPDMPTHYGIGLQHEAALSPQQRSRKTTYVPLNLTTNGFTVLSAEGPEGDPTSVTIKLEDLDKQVTITHDQPFKSQEGYTVDFRYPPENRNLPANRRVGDVISFGGEGYKIIDIKESEVVLLQQSNQKQWIKKFTLNASSTATSLP
ncbi:MAG TPA: hypothetical protein VKV04_23995 [Verrucomicrobiae bacterium]|nr:hypothetical protein [Verrucomicrobiae bacterium]